MYVQCSVLETNSYLIFIWLLLACFNTFVGNMYIKKIIFSVLNKIKIQLKYIYLTCIYWLTYYSGEHESIFSGNDKVTLKPKTCGPFE